MYRVKIRSSTSVGMVSTMGLGWPDRRVIVGTVMTNGLVSSSVLLFTSDERLSVSFGCSIEGIKVVPLREKVTSERVFQTDDLPCPGPSSAFNKTTRRSEACVAIVAFFYLLRMRRVGVVIVNPLERARDRQQGK